MSVKANVWGILLCYFFSFLWTNKRTVFEIFCLIFSIVATMGQERVERHNYIGKKCLFFLIPSTVIGKTHYRYTVQAHSSGQLRQHCRLFGSLIKAGKLTENTWRTIFFPVQINWRVTSLSPPSPQFAREAAQLYAKWGKLLFVKNIELLLLSK